MKLFLASEGKNPKTIENLKKFVDGFEGKSIAYIVTAANGEGLGSWKDSQTLPIVKGLGAKVEIMQLEDYWNKPVMPDLKEKDIIWFAGGFPGYLLYWMRRTKLDKDIKTLLDAGTIYVGSSAGSMVTGQSSDHTHWYVGEEEAGSEVIPHLKIVDFDFYPHYRDELYDEVNKRYNGFKLYLVKDGESITVVDGNVEVQGEERIIEKIVKF
jgi:dipeptidase E